VIEGHTYVIKAGISRWARHLVDELAYLEPRVAAFFRSAEYELPTRTETRESWRLP
jgi:hypothetical protein